MKVEETLSRRFLAFKELGPEFPECDPNVFLLPKNTLDIFVRNIQVPLQLLVNAELLPREFQKLLKYVMQTS